MLPAGTKVFTEAVDDHSGRTEIIASFGSLTVALTLLPAGLIPWLYTINPSLTWVTIGTICAISGVYFIKRMALGRVTVIEVN